MTNATQSPHVDLKNLPPNGYVDGIYSLVNPQIGTTKGGKPYLKCLLRDATGECPARQWTFDESVFDALSATGFVWIAGHTQLYNGQCQIILEQIKAVDVSDEELASLLPSTKRDIGEMFEEARSLLGTLEHPAIKALADTYLADEELMERFRRAPAAMNMHHAWIGGLLEHTLQLLKLADAMLPLYPQLNRDIVLMGLFLHDLGKTVELTWERGFNYTADGNLIGHIVRGAIILQVKAAMAAKSGHKLPAAALRVLQHIILSHHGTPEFGAAKIPSTPEAIFVAQLDNLDAKTAMAITHARADGPPSVEGAGEFTDKVWALQTRLYCPDPLMAEEL
ncbi:MAG TPA: HD domain-containing protein [Phycisphaerales bacterium]|nr:HD domain-containing protein [Phycisphaerales bacterium]HRQ75729.1 HD domain-containing protein [Phycisphaerales bacterium]